MGSFRPNGRETTGSARRFRPPLAEAACLVEQRLQMSQLERRQPHRERAPALTGNAEHEGPIRVGLGENVKDPAIVRVDLADVDPVLGGSGLRRHAAHAT